MNKKLSILLLLLCIWPAVMQAQSQSLSLQTSYVVYISIPDTSIITNVSSSGKPTFSVAGINTLFNQYSVSGFTKAFPGCRFLDMRCVYKMIVDVDFNLTPWRVSSPATNSDKVCLP